MNPPSVMCVRRIEDTNPRVIIERGWGALLQLEAKNEINQVLSFFPSF